MSESLRPLPQPTSLTEPYWRAAHEGRLVVQGCTACGHRQFYPRPFCLHCESEDVAWQEVSGNGNTLLLGATPLVQLQTVFKSLPYDTFRDFAPLARIALSSDVFATPASAQIGSVRELLAKAKAEAGKYSYGSYGNGTSAHMHGELLRMQAHVDLTHVAYKGGAPLVQDLMGGQVTSGFVDASGYRPAMGAAKVRPLAVTGERRLRGLPDVPTFTELGYRDFEPNGWYGLFVPAATPKAIRDKLSVAVLAALAKPDLEKAIREQGLESGTLGPEAFATVMRRDAEIWARIATTAKITAD
ncbi:tripartite tricarboxylate transporter substrate-binding protein [Cupriavidus campinensis]